MIKAKNIISKRGNPITNQIIIDDNKKDTETFQSYNSIIAIKDYKKGKTTLDEYYWNYSPTTSKYRNIFLGEKKKDTEKKIKQGIYALTDLNNLFARKRILTNLNKGE